MDLCAGVKCWRAASNARLDLEFPPRITRRYGKGVIVRPVNKTQAKLRSNYRSNDTVHGKEIFENSKPGVLVDIIRDVGDYEVGIARNRQRQCRCGQHAIRKSYGLTPSQWLCQ